MTFGNNQRPAHDRQDSAQARPQTGWWPRSRWARGRAWRLNLVLLITVMAAAPLAADPQSPARGAAVMDIEYRPAKVVYDLFSADPKKIANILDRVSLLQNLYGTNPFEASIVVVVHGGSIPIFSQARDKQHGDLMRRARSLIQSEVIQFRMCAASARMQGYQARDIQDFVTMVPMADAELVRLQHAGYAYMQ